jgi:hypothetical protein
MASPEDEIAAMKTIAVPTLVSRGAVSLCPVLPPEAGLRIVRIRDPDAFAALLDEHLFGLVITTASPKEVPALVRRLRLTAADAHLVVLSSGTAPAIGDAASIAGPHVAVLRSPVELPRLVEALRFVWFEGSIDRMCRAARDRELRSVVRCAISRIVEQRITVANPEPDEVTIYRSLSALAAACGTTRETLRRSSLQCGVDLKAVMQGWHVALALRERFVGAALPRTGVWRTIARRCGYESDAGLRALMKRELGVGLPTLGFTHLRKQMEHLETRVVGGPSS